MTDIVDRLRKPSGIGEPMDHMAMEEAANEIERLRLALDLCRQAALAVNSDPATRFDAIVQFTKGGQ